MNTAKRKGPDQGHAVIKGGLKLKGAGLPELSKKKKKKKDKKEKKERDRDERDDDVVQTVGAVAKPEMAGGPEGGEVTEFSHRLFS